MAQRGYEHLAAGCGFGCGLKYKVSLAGIFTKTPQCYQFATRSAKS